MAHVSQEFRLRLACEIEQRRAVVEQVKARVAAELKKKTDEGRVEYTNLQTQIRELRAGEVALSDAEKQVNADVKLKKEAIVAVQKEHEELQKERRARGVMDGDTPLESIIRTDVRETQVVECVATDYACLDAMDALGEALALGSIDIDKFLRETRRLSVDMYNARALKNKVRSVQREAREARARAD